MDNIENPIQSIPQNDHQNNLDASDASQNPLDRNIETLSWNQIAYTSTTKAKVVLREYILSPSFAKAPTLAQHKVLPLATSVVLKRISDHCVDVGRMHLNATQESADGGGTPHLEAIKAPSVRLFHTAFSLIQVADGARGEKDH